MTGAAAAVSLVAPAAPGSAGSAPNDLPPLESLSRYCPTADDIENMPLPSKPWPCIDAAIRDFPPAGSEQHILLAYAWAHMPDCLKSTRLGEALRYLEITYSEAAFRNLLRKRYTVIKYPLIAVLHQRLLASVRFSMEEGLL